MRVIVNGKEIYSLANGPVIIQVSSNNPKIVATYGHYFTKPLELVFKKVNTYYVQVACAVDDNHLAAGGLVLALLYFIGFSADIFFIKLISFFPVAYLLYYYYKHRKNFIQLKRAG